VGGPRSIATVQDLAFVDGNGNVERLHFQSGQYRFPRVAPDGKHLAVEVGDVRNAKIWIYDLAGTASPQQLTFEGRNRFPVWSHDSECLLFQSDREGDVAIFTQRADGSHTPDRLTKPEKGVAHVPLSWSRDGKTVLFDTVLVRDTPTAPVYSHSLSMLSLADRRVEPFGDVQSSAGPTHAVLSPDDRWVAYAFLEPHLGPSVYVQSFPPTGAKRLVRKGALAPMWSPTGDELFVGGHPDVFRVERVTRTQSGFTLGNPTERPRRGFIPLIEARNFDIMPDGRIIGVVNARETRPSALRATQIQVVLNWFEELKRLAPTR
jgi:Tol biopolymer transport system component